MRILDLYIFTTVPKPKFFQLRFPEGYKKGEILFRPEKGTENSGSPIPHSRNTSPQGLMKSLDVLLERKGSFSRTIKEMNFGLTNPAFPLCLPAWSLSSLCVRPALGGSLAMPG